VDTIISHSADETFRRAQDFARELRRGDVLALAGELGGGKTQFVKGVASGLGHDDAVTSPTFTLIHEYTRGRLPLYHFDFYRAENAAEILRLGFDDYLGENGIVAIEWADKFPDLLPATARWIRFRLRPDGAREITLA
jgi:tRNA threonylcarbamoyladenosine biosynthesis protein TsaE